MPGANRPTPRSLEYPPSALLAGAVQVAPGMRALLLHSADPALAAWIVGQVGPAGQVIALHSSHSALQSLARVRGLTLSDAVYPDPKQHGPADLVLIELPKGRGRARALLWTAAAALHPGAILALAGANAAGAKSAIADAAALLGRAGVVGYRAGCRVAIGTRPPAITPPAAWGAERPWEPQMQTIARPEGDFALVTMPGVFFWEHLDDGTALLLDHLGAEPDQDVLDIGCGSGILGLAAARAGARAWLVDDDLLAVRCAAESVRANSLSDRCTVLASDLTSSVRDRRFDLVLSNPPFHHGVAVDTGIAERLVREVHAVLRPGGRLRLVANRFLPYDRALRAVFGAAQTIAETGRFRVLEAVAE